MEIDFGVMFFSSTDPEFKDGQNRILKIKHALILMPQPLWGTYYRFAHVSLPVQCPYVALSSCLAYLNKNTNARLDSM